MSFEFNPTVVTPLSDVRVEGMQIDRDASSEHAQAAALASCEMTDLFAQGRSLRAAAEEFVVWTRFMGENDGAQSWGETQRTCAENWRARYRAKAHQFKADATGRETIVESVWSGRVRLDYDETVTQAARRELGL